MCCGSVQVSSTERLNDCHCHMQSLRVTEDKPGNTCEIEIYTEQKIRQPSDSKAVLRPLKRKARTSLTYRVVRKSQSIGAPKQKFPLRGDSHRPTVSEDHTQWLFYHCQARVEFRWPYGCSEALPLLLTVGLLGGRSEQCVFIALPLCSGRLLHQTSKP